MVDNLLWCIEQHRETNHFYDKYLPYEFHLRMVHQVFMDFKHLLETDWLREVCSRACWGHDLIEDARKSYNDCFVVLGKEAADIIYAVTNEKGKFRRDRANEHYYLGIRNTPGAVFVKLCDRIANVQYGKLTKSSMFEKYKEENPHFIKSLDVPTKLQPMVDYLQKLFND